MLIGHRLDNRYKIEELVGGGGMAHVYRARDMILDRDVAIKVLRFDYSNDEQFIKRFRREAQAATTLNNPHIVGIYDVGQEEHIYYMVMEYVEGQTLKQYIQDHAPLPVEKALSILEQIATGLAHAHHHQIVHRDIKPQNMLIDENGFVKITDFGIAVALSSATVTHTTSVLGSVHYLSPEQARGGMATKKSDIYSLGICFFEMLTGAIPFSGESAVAIALKHLQSETPSIRALYPSIPQSVENIVLKATAKDPFYRYETIDEMLLDIQSALQPQRLHEQRFTIAEDDEMTKAIPIIKEEPVVKPPVEKVTPQRHEPTPQRHEPKQQEQPKPKQVMPSKKEKLKKSPVFWLSIVFGALVVIGIVSVLLLPRLMMTEEVEVPKIEDMTLDEAKDALKDAKLKVKDVIDIEDDKIEEGHIVKSDPYEGSAVKEGTAVTLYQSSGEKEQEMIDVTGSSEKSAREQLAQVNVRSIDVEYVESDEDEGTVIEQQPAAGDQVKWKETDVSLKVSKGIEKIDLKDLTGYTEKSVKDYAANQGISVNVKQDYSSTVAQGLVASQSPSAGTKVKQGDTIDVIISLGPKETPPKKVAQYVQIPYDDTLYEGEPVQAYIYIEDANHTIDQVLEVVTITEQTRKKIEFSIAKGSKATYQIVINDEVVQEGTIPY